MSKKRKLLGSPADILAEYAQWADSHYSPAEYGEGLPDAPKGFFWMDSDGPAPAGCELALDASGHIWILAPKE